jgi:hypothetical protein
MSAYGTKRTSSVALQMSAFDPKQTWLLRCTHAFGRKAVVIRNGTGVFSWYKLVQALVLLEGEELIDLMFIRVFLDRANECRTIAELFHAEKTRGHLLKVAADYERMADKAEIFELQDADQESPQIW